MKLKNISIGDFIEAKNKHGGDVGFDVLEVGKSYEVLGFNKNSDLTVIISVPEHKTFSDGFYVRHECFRKPKPLLKQLDQSVFNGIDEKWRFAARCLSGKAIATESEPRVVLNGYYCEGGYLLIGEGYDTSNWQNSLIERDIAKELLEVDLSGELTGSDLCRAMLERGDKYVMCLVSDSSEHVAIQNEILGIVTGTNSKDLFTTSFINAWRYAVPINNQGEPLTAAEVGL